MDERDASHLTDAEEIAQAIADRLRELRSVDPLVRGCAAAGLGAYGIDCEPAIRPLLDACGDSDDNVREAAVCSLAELAAAVVGVVPSAERDLVAGIPTLIVMLDDPSECTSCAAAQTLEKIGPSAAVALRRLQELARSPDPSRRMSAKEAIAAIARGGRRTAEWSAARGTPTSFDNNES